jgi:hypothetical protein
MRQNSFKKYSQEQPKEKGYYIWRCNHKFIKDVKITFIAEFRWRGAGQDNILSPEFDYWDGYRVIVQQGLEWDYYDGEKPKYGQNILSINDLEIKPCPFCNEVPELKYRARHITGNAIDTDWFQFTCCSWASSPMFYNPVELIENRNSLII